MHAGVWSTGVKPGLFDRLSVYNSVLCVQVLGFTLEEQDVIFRIISSILHLGNVYFHRKQLKHGQFL